MKRLAMLFTSILLILCFAIPGPALAEAIMMLPARLTAVSERAFEGSAATRVVLPDGLKRIEARAFADSALTHINLPESLTYIAPDAFSGCEKLAAFVAEGSYAETWCQKHNIRVKYSDIWSGMADIAESEGEVTGDGQVYLSWDGSEDIYYAVFEKVGNAELLVTTVLGNTALLGGLDEGKHTFVVRASAASNGSGALGAASNPITLKVSGEAFREGPRWMGASEVSANTVELWWSWSDKIQMYHVMELYEDGEMDILESVDWTNEVTLEDVPAGMHTYIIFAEFEDCDAMSDTRQVYVVGEVQSVTLENKSVTMWAGATMELEAEVTPVDAWDNYVRWTSSDTGVATVESNYHQTIVTAVSEGTATITASTANGASASMTVKVNSVNSTAGGLQIVDGVLKGYTGNASKVTIPKGVTRIADRAFYGCDVLGSIVIPDTVEYIGDSAFALCPNLASVTIPDGIKVINRSTFAHCTGLQSVSLPDSVTEIMSTAFDECSSLKAIELPNSELIVHSYAFNDCFALKSVKFPEAPKSIEASAFNRCVALESVELSVKDVGAIFKDCANLKSVTLLDGTETVGSAAFSTNNKLETVKLANTITSIGDSAFEGAKLMKTLKLSQALTSIGDKAFYQCNSLASVKLPDTLITIGKSAFAYTSLSSITIPEGVKTVGDSAFSCCKRMKTAKIADSVTYLGGSAFVLCNSLTSVTLPKNLTAILQGTFSSCDSLTSITIPKSVSSIGPYAFASCLSLTSVTIPKGVTSIQEGTFSACGKLLSVTIPDTVTVIGERAFENCKSLNALKLPKSVATIEKYAFTGCTNLTAIKLPPNLKTINDSAFYNCNALQSVDIPANVTSIGANAFGTQYQDGKEECTYRVVAGTYAATWAADVDSVSTPADGSNNKVLDPPESITASVANSVMHVGDTQSVDVKALPAGKALQLAYSYDSSYPEVAAWDGAKNALVAKSSGETTITVHSYNDKTASFKVTVLPQGWTQNRRKESLAALDNQYTWMLFYDDLLNEGGTHPDGLGIIAGADLKKITGNIVQIAYANVLGYSAGTSENKLTQAMVIFHSTLLELSPDKEDSSFLVTMGTLKDVLKILNIGANDVEAFLKMWAHSEYSWLYMPKNYRFDKAEGYFKDFFSISQLKLFKGLTIMNSAAGTVKGIVKSVELYFKYRSVDPERVKTYIHALRKSNNQVLNYAAAMLETFINGSEEDKLQQLLAYNGLKPAVDQTVTTFVKAGVGSGVKLLAKHLVRFGPVAVAIASGTTIGKSVNSLVLNIDDIQEAAFKAQYLVNVTNDYRKVFETAYKAFQADPYNPLKFYDFALSYAGYREMLGQTYDAYASIPKAIDKSIWNKLVSAISGKSKQSNVIEAPKEMAKRARTYMDYDLIEYGEAFFPGLGISQLLAH